LGVLRTMVLWRRKRHTGVEATPAIPDDVLDGAVPITVSATLWQEQFQELWNLLVPNAGNAETEQGEVIRLAGKLTREILDNGSVNWDADFRSMADALTAYPASRMAVADGGELAALRKIVRVGHGDKPTLYRLTELAVAWVLANPYPVPLRDPPYRG
jgi:hypothetical protein